MERSFTFSTDMNAIPTMPTTHSNRINLSLFIQITLFYETMRTLVISFLTRTIQISTAAVKINCIILRSYTSRFQFVICLRGNCEGNARKCQALEATCYVFSVVPVGKSDGEN